LALRRTGSPHPRQHSVIRTARQRAALLLEDWQSFPLQSLFEPYRLNWTVPASMRQQLSSMDCLKLGIC
jgi:hypothetical protein